MDMLPPLLTCHPLPLLESLLQWDDRMAGTKNAAACATTVAKVGIVACATASIGAVTDAMDVIAWQQSCNDIDDNNKHNDQCQ